MEVEHESRLERGGECGAEGECGGFVARGGLSAAGRSGYHRCYACALGSRTFGSGAARAADQGVGSRARVPAGRHHRHRPRRRGGAPARVARSRLARRHGLYGTPRHPPRAPARAGARHGARDLGAHGLPAGSARGELVGDRRSRSRVRLPLCARPRLPQGHAAPPAAARRSDRGRGGRTSAIASSPTAVRCWKSRSRRAPGSGWRGKHTLAALARGRFVVLPG